MAAGGLFQAANGAQGSRDLSLSLCSSKRKKKSLLSPLCLHRRAERLLKKSKPLLMLFVVRSGQSCDQRHMLDDGRRPTTCSRSRTACQDILEGKFRNRT